MTEIALTIADTPIPPITGVPSGGLFPMGENILRTGLQLMFIAAIVLSLFFILWAGIQWITSGGDKEALAKARARLTYAVIGLIIVFLAFFIVNLIGGFFGINLVGPTPSGGGGEG